MCTIVLSNWTWEVDGSMKKEKKRHLGSWRDCASQKEELHGRSRGEIWSLYSKCSSVTKVTLCGAFHFPGASNAEWVCVCVCLQSYDPSLDTHTHTHIYTTRLPLLTKAWHYCPNREPETRTNTHTQHIKNTERPLWGSACIESED